MTGVRVDTDGLVRTVTIERPERVNALRSEDMAAIADAVRTSAGAGARVVLLRGCGEHFCSGADLHAAAGLDGLRQAGGMVEALRTGGHRMIREVWDCPVPVVAAVQGAAEGVGCGLALAADIVVAGESAGFRLPFVLRGLSADSGSTFLLPRLVGVARASAMLLRGQRVDAPTAQRWGMVAEVCPDGELDTVVTSVVAEFAAAATLAVGLTKGLLHRHLGGIDLGAALDAEATAVDLTLRSADMAEGVRAFRRGTEPRFSGR